MYLNFVALYLLVYFVSFVLLGNNDLFIDYLPPVANDSTLYMDIRQIIEPYLFLNSSNASSVIKEFRGTFDVGGFYKFTLKGKALVLMKVEFLDTLILKVSDERVQTTLKKDIKAINYFKKTLNLRCLTVFWICTLTWVWQYIEVLRLKYICSSIQQCSKHIMNFEKTLKRLQEIIFLKRNLDRTSPMKSSNLNWTELLLMFGK